MLFIITAQKKNLNILGLMIIPPNNQNTKDYFKEINHLNKSLALGDLSMGMFIDYLEAVEMSPLLLG